MTQHSKESLEHGDKAVHFYKLCKNKIYLGVLLTMFLSNFAISVSGVFLPHFIRTQYSTSYSSQMVSSISILGAGDLCGRLMAGVLGNYLSISKLLVLSIDILFIGIGNLVISLCISYTLVMACTFIVGFGAVKRIISAVQCNQASNQVEFFTMWSHLHFKPKFTSRSLKNFKKLPPVGFELTTLTITGSKVECLSK